MSGQHDHAQTLRKESERTRTPERRLVAMDVPQWEPEPLHLPVNDGADEGHRRGNRNRTGGNDRERDRDLPGSHVIVIDLA